MFHKKKFEVGLFLTIANCRLLDLYVDWLLIANIFNSEQLLHVQNFKSKKDNCEPCYHDVVGFSFSMIILLQVIVYTLISTGLNSSTDKETAEMENIKYKNILFEFQEMLLENLDPEEVSHQLTEAGVLTPDDKDKIKEKQTRKDKSEQLLMILATKGPAAYEEFVKALEKDHCSLACQLLKEGRYSAGQRKLEP